MKKFLVVFVLFGGAGYGLLYPTLQKRASAESFAPALQKYRQIYLALDANSVTAEMPWDGGRITLDAGKMPSRRGKIAVLRVPRRSDGHGVMVIDKNEPPALDDAWGKLDDAARASKPDEVGTLVFVDLVREKGEAYGRVGSLRRSQFSLTLCTMTAMITVYDVASKTCQGTWAVGGPEPPGVVKESEIGNLPGPPVLEFLKAMLVKN